MKRIKLYVSTALTLLLMIQIGICGFAQSKTNTIVIKSAEELDAVRNKLDGNYVLENDIDLSTFENWIPIGTKEAPFTGIFDGGNHKITNITITDIGKNEYAGLLGYAKFAEIKGVKINGTINIKADNVAVAGICAFAEESHIKRCLNNVNISVKSDDSESIVQVGGITGNLYKGTVTECSNIGNIYDEKQSKEQNEYALSLVGGIAGRAEGQIKDCRNAGDIQTVDNADYTATGGIVGLFHGAVHTGQPGIVGEKFKGYMLMHNVCNIGRVNSYPTEGGYPIVGMQEIWSLDTYNPDEPKLYSGCYYLDSCVESSYSNSDFKSFNMENGQKKEFFPEFDFENVWDMSLATGMPVLGFEETYLTRSIKVKAGETIKLELSGATVQKATSEDEKIAYANGDEITGVHRGKTEIRILLDDNTEIKYEVTVSFSLIYWIKSFLKMIYFNVFGK